MPVNLALKILHRNFNRNRHSITLSTATTVAHRINIGHRTESSRLEFDDRLPN